MVGLFSRISGRVAHRPQQSLEEKEVNDIVSGVRPLENEFNPNEFAAIEHPLEPPDLDKPARCPAPEPCIVHDGRIWKERAAANARRRLDLAKAKDDATPDASLTDVLPKISECFLSYVTGKPKTRAAGNPGKTSLFGMLEWLDEGERRDPNQDETSKS